MFSELFIPPSQLDLEDLEEPTQKKACTEVAAVEEEMLKQEGLPDTSKETILFPTSLPVPTEFSLEKEFQSTISYLEEPSGASGQKITKTTPVPFVVSIHKTKIACTHIPDGTLTSLSDVPGWVVEKCTRPLMA